MTSNTEIIPENNAHRPMEVPVRIVIVAAGTGSRYGGDIPKQFCLLEGRPVLMWTIDGLRKAFGPSALMVLVLSETMKEYWLQECDKYAYESPQIISGGDTRWQSVCNALKAMPGHNGVTLVHDGARPVTDAAVLYDVVRTAHECGACIPVTPLTDSIRHKDGEERSHAVPRAEYMAVQTPQGFDSSLLEKAYCLPYSKVYTDDASVVEAMGVQVRTCPGNSDNIKITNPGDLEIARLYMVRRGIIPIKEI